LFLIFLYSDSHYIFRLGENKYKYGEQRVWGAVGWGMISFVSGAVIDWFSKGQDYKNYTPGMIISLVTCSLNVFVALKIEVNINYSYILYDIMRLKKYTITIYR